MRTRTALGLSVGAGAVSALGTYIVFHPKLRKELMEADSAMDAAAILSEHIKEDALDTADQAMQTARRHGVGTRFARALHEARMHARAMTHEARAMKRDVKHHARKARHHARTAVKHATHGTMHHPANGG